MSLTAALLTLAALWVGCLLFLVWAFSVGAETDPWECPDFIEDES